jgi:ribonuclease BN (tRNA processing enzyme)
MQLTVLGSGDAFSGCGCNAGYLVDDKVLVDCGAPVPALARRAAIDLPQLRLILLTHFHADHTFMLPVVIGACALTDTPGPPGLVIAGPVGTREYVNRLLVAGYGRHIIGLIHDAIAPRFVQLQDGDDVEIAGYRVRAHAVVHSLGPSLAYSVSDATGTRVGFSGDSTLCPGLARAIRGSDLFVCECTGWGAPVPGGHLWSDEVAELIAANPSTTFLLSHLKERHTLPGALIAHDLLTLDVGAPRSAD